MEGRLGCLLAVLVAAGMAFLLACSAAACLPSASIGASPVLQVIGYIASHFRKDKIWMRRTRPDKRKYQVGGGWVRYPAGCFWGEWD